MPCGRYSVDAGWPPVSADSTVRQCPPPPRGGNYALDKAGASGDTPAHRRKPMLPSDLTSPVYADEAKAREYLESVRWPEGPVCPHCGCLDAATKLAGKAHRAGLYQCKECSQQFSVTVGTLYERSHIPLHKWLFATHLMAASKKGISAHQLMRTLGLGSYRTAWFMAHRIREGMAPKKGPIAPLGGEGKVLEADTTYIGGKEKN